MKQYVWARRRLFNMALLLLVPLLVFAYQRMTSTRWGAAVLNTAAMRPVYRNGDELLGGGTTIVDTSRDAFGRSLRNLVTGHWDEFYQGKVPFERDWDRMLDRGPAPVGPFFSAVGCERCHDHDGRGRPPESNAISESMIVRFSLQDADGSWVPDPVYGEQLDMYHIGGEQGEGIVQVRYDDVAGEFADGGSFTLAKPEYSFHHLRFGPMNERVRFSPRVAPFNFGLGLLEAIPERDILAAADPDDANHDGISGRANRVPDVARKCTTLGRFGWKAGQPTIEQQIAKAFNADIGITSTLYPDDVSGHASANGRTQPELGEQDFRTIVTYVRLLAVPRQRNWQSPVVQHGGAVFNGIQCASCHTTRFETGDVPGYPELSHQVIHPYTDLLLHDMGDGLADNRPDGVASGSEWRTPPLWGIGLVKNVNGHSRFLHDGRARNLEEAILWHGGEAAASQELYRRLSVSDRAALIAFLESL
ncbi:MAG: thiol oxidoreductase [Bacteroidetes bacterium]|nr:thiol oxidoreductase [Bacteroidota bacterium]